MAILGFYVVAGFVTARASGDPRSFWIVLPAVGLLAASLLHRVTALHYLLVVGTWGALGWLFGRLGLGLVVGTAFVVYLVVRSRTLPSDLTADTILAAAADAVGPGAERFVEEFAGIGYRQVGAYTFRAMGNEIVASVMRGPANDRYAIVTDAILTVTSRFGARSLVTRNSAVSRLPPFSLDNPLRGADPEELDRSHSEALAVVSPHARPDPLPVDGVAALAMEDERRTIGWIRTERAHLQPGGGKGHGALASHPGADTLIFDWLTRPVEH